MSRPAAADLEAAYRATSYLVDGPDGTVRIRVGATAPEVDGWLRGAAVPEWAFVTACNPGSQPLDADANAVRQSALEDAVRAGGWAFRRGRGVGDDGRWPPEESVLILGIGVDAALELARRFGQVAIVCGAVGGPARLEWAATAGAP